MFYKNILIIHTRTGKTNRFMCHRKRLVDLNLAGDRTKSRISASQNIQPRRVLTRFDTEPSFVGVINTNIYDCFRDFLRLLLEEINKLSWPRK